jgi:predicted Zn finger-like uncharacterized protein
MQTTVPCPSCRRELRVPDSLIGKLVKCPACAQTFTANLSQPTPPVEAPAMPETYRAASPPAEDFVDEPAPREQENDYEPRLLPSRRRRRFYVEHRGAMVLTLGILSLVICGLLGPVAWVMGNNDLAAMRAGRMDPAGEGITQAGRICGIIATALIAFICVFYCGVAMIAGLGQGFK